MKRALFSLGCVLAIVSVGAAQRLPKTAAPENYKLTFAPDFTGNKFGGEETIRIRVLKPTSEIVLNAVELEFQEVSIKSGEVRTEGKCGAGQGERASDAKSAQADCEGSRDHPNSLHRHSE
jgi:aminopeptidase N